MYFCPILPQIDVVGVTWVLVQPFQFADCHNLQEFGIFQSPVTGSPLPDTMDIGPRPQNMGQFVHSSSQKQQNKKNNEVKGSQVGRKIKMKAAEEEEFDPNSPETRKRRRAPQNQNRNVIPNIMHQVVSFVQRRNRSEKLVQKLMTELRLPQVCSAHRFYCYQMRLKDKLNHYLNAESVKFFKQLQEPSCQFFSESEQRHYNKISRLLVRYYLTREFDTAILTSVRMCSQKKREHLAVRRRILEQILVTLKQ